MYHTTGLSREEIVELTELVERCSFEAGEMIGCPPSLGLFGGVCVTLMYLRRNRTQFELAEQYETSQPTISRAISCITPWLDRVLVPEVPVAEELSLDEQYIVDGTLLPCWSWVDRPELYSGKRKTTGVNVQVVCDVYGRLRWVSDPVDGCRHDSAAIGLPGVLDGMDLSNWFGDLGYLGTGVLTPVRKPRGHDFADSDTEYNTAFNAVRATVERVIAHLKTWRIFHTDYRRPFHTFATTISAVIGLEFFRNNAE
ncbi:transposase family protein [Nocardia sp. CA-135953]|uniref:transposase family protein n=1 Tax=Nocardia sp. CA-135953 TaxID=3239978 RepID=UPI003D986225